MLYLQIELLIFQLKGLHRGFPDHWLFLLEGDRVIDHEHGHLIHVVRLVEDQLKRSSDCPQIVVVQEELDSLNVFLLHYFLDDAPHLEASLSPRSPKLVSLLFQCLHVYETLIFVGPFEPLSHLLFFGQLHQVRVLVVHVAWILKRELRQESLLDLQVFSLNCALLRLTQAHYNALLFRSNFPLIKMFQEFLLRLHSLLSNRLPQPQF